MNNTWEKKILARIKTRLGIETSNTKNDDLLKDYIKSSFDEIIVHTQSNSYDLSYDNKLIQCVVFLYNKRGLEGVVSRSANGISDDLSTYTEDKNKSLSTSETFSTDIGEKKKLLQTLYKQVDILGKDLRKQKLYTNTLAITYKTSDFVSYSKQMTLSTVTNSTEEISKYICERRHIVVCRLISLA